jgi:hypothetical protein
MDAEESLQGSIYPAPKFQNLKTSLFGKISLCTYSL